jgi:hypothetical protein
MKLKFVSILFIAVAVLSAQPRFFVENKRHDWGTVTEGNKVLKHSFVVVNKGSDTLKITNIRASCGCTVASYDSIVAPGKTGRIAAEFDIRGRTGRQENTLVVMSNDADSSQIRLRVVAFIKSPLDVSPRWLALHSNRGRVNGTLSFLTEEQNFTIEKAQHFAASDNQRTSPTTINMTQKSRTGPDENGNLTYEFDFSFNRSVERFENGILVFETNVKEKSSVSLNVSIELQDTLYN